MKGKIVTSLAVVFLFQLGTGFSPARAELASPSPTPSNWDGCDNFCSMLVNKKGKILGLDGSVGWTAADDQWCADHNAQTNINVMASPLPGATPSESCSVPLQPGDTTCVDAKAKYQHCLWHNGQVEQHCQAYVTATQANSGNKTVMFLDFAAAGTCATACAVSSTGVGAAIQKACDAAGLGAGAMEIMEVLKQKSSMVAKAINVGMSGFGMYNSGKDLFAGSAKPAPGSTPNNQSHGIKGACISAALFGVQGIMRSQSIKSANKSKKNACDAVESLLSSASTVGGASGAALNGSIGNALSGGTSGNTGSMGGANASLQCMSGGGTISACAGQSAGAATDAGMLTDSGLAGQVAPQAAQLAQSPLGQDLGNGQGDPMAALGSGMGSAGDAGNAVMTVAAAALQHPIQMDDGIGAYSGGGGGGGAPAPSNNGGNPMAALAALLHPAGQNQMPAGGTQVFGNQAPDIWHRNSDENIFQIVSGRIEKASIRLH